MDNAEKEIIYVGMDMDSSIGVMDSLYDADYEILESRWKSIKRKANGILKSSYAFGSLMDMAITNALDFGYIQKSSDHPFAIEPITDLDDICIYVTLTMFQTAIGAQISDSNWQKLCNLDYTTKGIIDQLLDEAMTDACCELGLIEID